MPLTKAHMMQQILGPVFATVSVSEPCGKQWLVHKSDRHVVVCDANGRSHLVMDNHNNCAYRQLRAAHQAILRDEGDLSALSVNRS